jgi:hypothetical protein
MNQAIGEECQNTGQFASVKKVPKFLYPILGGLSRNVRCRLVKKFGPEGYDPDQSWRDHLLAEVNAFQVLGFLTWATAIKLDGSGEINSLFSGVTPYMWGSASVVLLDSITSAGVSGGPRLSCGLVGKLLSLPWDIPDKIRHRNYYDPKIRAAFDEKYKGF